MGCVLRRLCAACGLSLALGLGGEVHAAKALSAVADLRYGSALYHYYLNHNLQALSELMVAEQRGGIQGHGDNPELMVGGFAMAYGLERRATDIFTRLLDQNRPRHTQDAAWFYLASMAYQRGDWGAAEASLAKISAKPQPQLAAEIIALAHNLALRRADLPLAESLLRRASSDWAPYMHYNLGAAYAREGQLAKAVEHFRQVQAERRRGAEFLALHDKTKTAAGYAHLFNEQPRQAIELFSQVRLHSPLSHRALLGYGWAAVAAEDYNLALRPWQELARRSLVDEHTQEVLVALPYAYEKLGHKGVALEAFRQAETGYLDELSRLRDVMRQVQGYAIREALNIDPSADINWLDQAGDLSPQVSYLVQLFAQERFLNRVQELRDLLAIQNQFAEWQRKIEFYRAMLDERERNRAAEMDYLAQQQLDQRIGTLEQSRDALAEQVLQLQTAADFLALTDADDSARLVRILRAEKNIEQIQRAAWDWGVQVMPAEELEALAESLRRQKGLMMWHAAEFYDERLWRARRELALLNDQLLQLRAVQGRVQNILAQGFDLRPYRQRLARAEEQLLVQSTDVDRGIELAQDALREQVLAVLDEQQQRLQHYLAQARLSIARLLDQSAGDLRPRAPAEDDDRAASSDVGGAPWRG